MSINKVIYDGNTLIDLTDDTVNASVLLAGYTAHDRSGALITGTFDTSIFVLKAGDTMTGALTLAGAPTSNLHAATKKYVDDAVGAITDENVKQTGLAGTEQTAYRILLSSTGNDTTTTAGVNKLGALRYTPYHGWLTVDKYHDGTTSSSSGISIGNTTTDGTAGSTYGILRIYGKGEYYAQIAALTNTLTADRTLQMPDQSGTIAVTSDIIDENVKQTSTSSATSVNYAILFSNSTMTAGSDPSTKTEGARISGGLFYNPALGTLYIRRIHSDTETAYSRLVLGNGIGDGTAGACDGRILVYGKGTKYFQIADINNVLTADRTLNVPDLSGTIACLEHIYTINGRITSIGENKNLNTAEFTKPGKYYCNATNAATLSNTPVTNTAFIMLVENSTGSGMGMISETASSYRRRVLYGAYDSSLMYVQICYTNSSSVESYGPWNRYTNDNRVLLLEGGTMTGALTLSGAPTTNLHAATKKYVDDAIAGTTDANVTQTNNNENKNFRVLLSNTNADTTETAGVKKSSQFYFNPYTGSATFCGNHSETSNTASVISLGNSYASGAAGKCYGVLRLYTRNGKYIQIVDNSTTPNTENVNIYPPNSSGTIALVSDLSSYLPLTGGTLTGALTLSGAPTSDLHAATKKYVDDNCTDTKVTISNNSVNNDKRVILGSTASNDTVTESVVKSEGLLFNTYTGQLKVKRVHTSTTSAIGSVVVGTNTADGTAGACHGIVYIYDKTAYWGQIVGDGSLTNNRSYYMPNASGTIALKADHVLKSGDTMTGTLNLTNSSVSINSITAAKAYAIKASAGTEMYVQFAATGNHGVWSSGYGSSLTDANTYTSDGKWIIYRSSSGQVYIPIWASRGSSGNPVYFNADGLPTSMTGSDIVNGLSVGSSASQRDDYIVTQYAGGGTTNVTYYRRALKNVFKALNADDITTALGYTPPTANTDENVKQTNSSNNNSYRILFSVSANDTTTTEGTRKSGALLFNPSTATMSIKRSHTATTAESGNLTIGNSVADGTAGASYGKINLYGKGSYYATIYDKNNTLTANREYYLPNESGTLVTRAYLVSVGDATTPVYFNSAGKPTVCTSIPASFISGDFVTSVALSGSKGISISGSPITSSGTITVSVSTSSGTATRNTTNTSTGEVKWTKYGRVVTVYTTTAFSITSAGATGSGKVLFSGLPKPAQITTFTGMNIGSSGTYDYAINTDGELYALGNSSGGSARVGCTYISAS